MGIGSSSSSAAHRRQHRPPPPQQPHNGDVIGASNSPISNPAVQQFRHYHSSAFHQPPAPAPAPANYPYGAPLRLLGAPFVEHQKTVTIKNDVNIKKDSIRIEIDEENPGKFLVAFTFDAATPGSITVMFYTKEDAEFNLVATKESLLDPVRVSFDKGLGQSFRQPCGTGVDFSLFEDVGLTREGDAEVYPLVVKAEAQVVNEGESDGNAIGNCQITQAVFEKENGEYKVRVVKQILWVDNMRYELQEIYGIGNAVEEGAEQNDDDEAGKECVICLSEPRDTTVLPCRHMCMCSSCAKLLRFQTNKCPVCRQPVERLLEI